MLGVRYPLYYRGSRIQTALFFQLGQELDHSVLLFGLPRHVYQREQFLYADENSETKCVINNYFNNRWIVWKLVDNLCPWILRWILLRSFLENTSDSSRTAKRWSDFDRFGTRRTAVNAETISISSNTCLNNLWYVILYFIANLMQKLKIYLLLLVHKTNNLRPFGGCFFNRTSKACNVKLLYLGPIEP